MGRTDALQRWSLVLAGGDGTRLKNLTQQITGAPIPKQYCKILGSRSLLETTLVRSLLYATSARTLVVVNHDHLALGEEQLREVAAENILVQPCNRETGPGILFALLRLKSRAPQAVVAVFPSDHYVDNDHAFIGHVNRASEIVAQHPDKIVLLGIRPHRPEPDYGYITPARAFRTQHTSVSAYRVAAFREKPPMDLARSLLATGSLWNSFVMVFRVNRMLELLRRIAPNEFISMQALHANPSQLAAQYPRLAPWNFSSHFLTRITQHLVVLPVEDVRWSDWGTRESIESTFEMLNQVPPWKHPASPRSAA
jgi:mannose-1-phosphate guanylyltransferase